MKEKIVQTAGRQQLGEFAPMFAHLNDDVLFGEVWNEDAIDVKTKCIVTVVSLMASGITDSSLTYHLQNAKNHGVTKEEMARCGCDQYPLSQLQDVIDRIIAENPDCRIGALSNGAETFLYN